MASDTPARIAVVFKNGSKAEPVWFELDRRQHRIVETTYHWKDQIGNKLLLHYAVRTENNSLYELVFSPVDQQWTLLQHPSE
ncbi:MAG TPA: hypothetical protein PLN25_07125 [Deltaproteobacteria bacterium]|nr:hypothetical protein [Deltaproteobacteria bacterium]HQB40070.1 hypothetical protein [Deltaproteobacteria bacterium]